LEGILEKSLAAEHLMDLQKSGLDSKTIEAAGIFSVPPDRINATLHSMNGTSVRSLLAFPYPGVDFTRYKLFPACKLNREDKHPRKYYQPAGSPIFLYEPPGFNRSSEIIRITEGEKKALKGTQEGLNVCGLGGIWNFASKDEDGTPRLIEALKNLQWTGKKVEIIPDGDFRIKQHVSHAVYRLGRMLEKEGAAVVVVRLPNDSKLDDYLCGHSVEAFSELELLTLEDRIFINARIKEEGLISAIELSCTNIQKFLSTKFEPRPYILKPILKPGTLAQIYSERGVGKTMLALSIALSITHKVSIGNWTPENPAGVLFIDGEMPCDEQQQRLKRLTLGLPDPLAPFDILSSEQMEQDGLPRINLVDDEWRKAIYQWLSGGTYKLLILDNLASLIPGIDENSSQDWSEIGQWLLSLRFLGIAVIFVHHAGKSGLPRGTSGREDALDLSLKLSHPRGYLEEHGCEFNVTFAKARSIFGIDAGAFNFRIIPVGSGGLTWEVRDMEGGLRNVIIAMFGNGYSASKITEAIGRDRSYIYKIRSEAIQAGFIEPDPEEKKALTFTEKGRIEFGHIKVS
jgi:hypothetical protein